MKVCVKYNSRISTVEFVKWLSDNISEALAGYIETDS
jgi:hypothetical protein